MRLRSPYQIADEASNTMFKAWILRFLCVLNMIFRKVSKRILKNSFEANLGSLIKSLNRITAHLYEHEVFAQSIH